MPAVVQHRTTFSNNTTTVAIGFSSNNAAGNLLVYASAEAADTLSAATDNNTNTISNAINFSKGTNILAAIRIDYVANSHSGANTVTAHDNTLGDIHLHIWEISGCVTTSPVRATGSGTGVTGSVSTSTSTPLSSDAVFAYFYDNPANQALTIGSGYTTSDISSNATGGDSALSEYKSATAGGTQTATCTGNGTDNLVQLIAVFIHASSSFPGDEDYWLTPIPPTIEPNITLWQ